MAPHNRSPQYLNRGCMCNWGLECLELKKLFAEAGHVSQTRMIPIKPGASDTTVALRSLVKFLFKLGPEYHNTDFYVAAHHWPPALIERNYKGSKSNRPSRQFKTLLTRSEAASYDCAMDVTSNNFASCLKRVGVLIEESDKRRLLFVQGPTNTLYNVRSYFDGLTDHRAIRIRKRLHPEQSHEQLAVPEAVSLASPLPNATTTASLPVLPLSPEIIPSLSLYSNYIREQRDQPWPPQVC
jgi:hypothetical protein